MARSTTFEVPTDTSLFSPMQLQPRAACTLAMSGWARWLREHWVPFPRLIEDHKLGVVIAGLEVEYLRPFAFFDSDSVVATTAVTVRSNGRLLFVLARLSPPEGLDVAHVRGVLRPVTITDGVILSAVPTDLDAETLARFREDEMVSEAPGRRLQTAVGELEAGGPPLAVTSRTFRLHRNLCETADQWSAIALSDVTTEVREDLAAARSADVPALAASLTEPMRSMKMEFRRPAFFLDEFTVECSAYAGRDAIAFVHRFCSVPSEELLATFVEWFPPSGTTTDTE